MNRWEPELEKDVARACKGAGAEFRIFGGCLLFEPEAIVTGGGKPYKVFTPFWKACLAGRPAHRYPGRKICASPKPAAAGSKT